MGQFEELNKAIELSDSQKYTIKTLEKEVKELKMVYDIVIHTSKHTSKIIGVKEK